MGTISVLETMLVPTLQRGNAAQDAPRPAVMRSSAAWRDAKQRGVAWRAHGINRCRAALRESAGKPPSFSTAWKNASQSPFTCLNNASNAGTHWS